MQHLRICLTILLVFLLQNLSAQDVVVHVDGEVSASGDGLTRTTAYKTIAEAVAHAPEPNQIHIWPSTYAAITVDVTGKGSISRPMRFIGREENLERVSISGGNDIFHGTLLANNSFIQIENIDISSTGEAIRYCTATLRSVNLHSAGRPFDCGTGTGTTDAFAAYDCLIVADLQNLYVIRASAIRVYNSTIRTTGAAGTSMMAVVNAGNKILKFINSVIWGYDNTRTLVPNDGYQPNIIEVRNSRFFQADTTGLTGISGGLSPVVEQMYNETNMQLTLSGSPDFTYELGASSPLRNSGVNGEVIGVISKVSGVRIGK